MFCWACEFLSPHIPNACEIFTQTERKDIFRDFFLKKVTAVKMSSENIEFTLEDLLTSEEIDYQKIF